MKADPVFGIACDGFVNLEHGPHFDLDAALLTQFAPCRIVNQLAHFYDAAGDRPAPARRLAAAPDQQRLALADDQYTHRWDGEFRIFARHGVIISRAIVTERKRSLDSRESLSAI